jgi:hypothetical protein
MEFGEKWSLQCSGDRLLNVLFNGTVRITGYCNT